LEIVLPERVVFTWTSECSVKDTKVGIELFERDGQHKHKERTYG